MAPTPLPPELVSAILHHATPNPSFSSALDQRRRQCLRNYSLVSPVVFQPWSQATLSSAVLLPDTDAIQAFWSSLRDAAASGQSLAIETGCRELRLGTLTLGKAFKMDDQSSEALRSILARLSGLKRMWICSVMDLSMDVLSAAHGLEELYFLHGSLHDEIPASDAQPARKLGLLRLPKLHSLYLTDIQFDKTNYAIARPRRAICPFSCDTLPQLKHLALTFPLWNGFASPFEPSPATTSSPSLLSQLVSLSTTQVPFQFLADLSLSNCSSFLLLDCWAHELAKEEDFDKLPHSIQLLRINESSSFKGTVGSFRDQLYASLKNGKLPNLKAVWLDDAGRQKGRKKKRSDSSSSSSSVGSVALSHGSEQGESGEEEAEEMDKEEQQWKRIEKLRPGLRLVWETRLDEESSPFSSPPPSSPIDQLDSEEASQAYKESEMYDEGYWRLTRECFED